MIYPRKSNKRTCLKYSASYLDRRTSEEDRRARRTKLCDKNNEDGDINPNINKVNSFSLLISSANKVFLSVEENVKESIWL